jgi:uncharacterized protein DUF6444
MDGRDRIIDELHALIAKQAARIAELELALAKAKKDSSISSKPPSSDIAKPKPKKPRGRRKKPRRGGQPGHMQQLREPRPRSVLTKRSTMKSMTAQLNHTPALSLLNA